MLFDAVNHKFSIVCRCVFFIALLLITLLSVAPPDQVTAGLGWDKANHALAFFILLLLLDYAHPRLAMLPGKYGLLLGYGLLIECFQALTPDRFSSIADLGADLAGLLLYSVLRSHLYWVYSRYFSRWFATKARAEQ